MQVKNSAVVENNLENQIFITIHHISYLLFAMLQWI